MRELKNNKKISHVEDFSPEYLNKTRDPDYVATKEEIEKRHNYRFMPQLHRCL